MPVPKSHRDIERETQKLLILLRAIMNNTPPDNFDEQLKSFLGKDFKRIAFEPAPKAKQSDAKPKGTPRWTLTPRHLTIISFVAKFPAATIEAIAQLLPLEPARGALNHRPHSNGQNVSISVATQLVNVLRNRGYLEYKRHPISGIKHYGATALSIEIAEMLEPNAAFKQVMPIAYGSLEHHAQIANVAAQLINPTGSKLQEYLKIKPQLEDLISETMERKGYARLQQLQKDSSKHNDKLTLGELRHRLHERLIADAANGSDYPQIMVENPELWPVCLPDAITSDPNIGELQKVIHPDLIINQPNRTDEWAHSVAVEVELNNKSREEYERRLRTWHYEITHGKVYEKLIYITTPAIAKTLLNSGGKAMVDNGQLILIPLKKLELPASSLRNLNKK